jgi:Ala-tRNA(Pro) deacylase
MTLSARLKWYLDSHGVGYRIVPPAHTTSSVESAKAAHVPRERLAKSVLLEDERGYVMVVLPASRRISLRDLDEQLERHLELASEAELSQLFRDCELGAVPPVGAAFGIPTVVDDSLLNAPDVWFEAGDHEDLVHMRGFEFLTLFTGARHGRFSRHA